MPAVHLRLGTFLDTTAPALLFGMAIGRVGCFFAGCCAGRPTCSRWGVWSSDRRIITARIPTQLLESALALVIGTATTLVLVESGPRPDGLLFVAAMAAYTLVRQALLSLRALERRTSFGTVLTAAAAAAALLASAVALVIAA